MASLFHLFAVTFVYGSLAMRTSSGPDELDVAADALGAAPSEAVGLTSALMWFPVVSDKDK
eukprot:2967057-Amphidinium_carterae.1